MIQIILIWIVFVVLYRKIEEILDLVGSVNGVGRYLPASVGADMLAWRGYVCV